MATVLSNELLKLRSDLYFSRQEAADGAAFIVKDPVTGRFFRFREAELFVTKQLDGATPLEVIGRKVEERFGEPISTETLKLFVDRLQQLGLLESATASGQQSRAESGRIRGDVFYLRLKAFDPDRLFDRLIKTFRFCFTRTFLLCSAALILFAFGLTLLNGQEIGRDLVGLYRVESILLLWLTILCVTTLHEFAHGLTCKQFGGEVHELGFMLLYFQPAFYCNVSDAWLFPEKSKRLWVSFAGAYLELCLWALATLTWRATIVGTWFHSVALVVMATLGIRSLFNMNPLIKLDGYYLLSDALEIPNLRTRAFRYLRAVLARTLLRSANAATQDALQATPRERKIYLTYSLLAGTFIAWLLGSMAWWVGGWLVERYQGVGFLLFTALLIGVFRHPLKRSARAVMAWLKTAPSRFASRKAPVRASLLFSGLLLVLFFGRLELTIYGEFTVLPIHNADVRAEVEGIIQEIYVDQGDQVNQGELIAILSDRDYSTELQKIVAELREKEANLKKLKAGPRLEEIELAKMEVEKAQERRKYARNNLERLDVLFRQELTSHKDFEKAEEEMAVRQKELEEAQGRLRVLLAGSRQEEIDAAEAEIARIEVQQRYLEEQLRLVRVVDPVSGVITTPKLKEKIGQRVEKGDLIAEVHELKTVKAEIAIPEKEIADVQVGQRVVLKVRAYPNLSFEGKVTSIAPIVTKGEETWEQRTILAMTELDNPSLLLKPEMTGNAKIFCGQQRIFDLVTRRLARYIRVEFWSWW